jgi:outer membrane immunogenic protein
MRFRIQSTFALLLAAAAVSVGMHGVARAQAQPRAVDVKPYRAELALDYTYLHSNAPPGGCGCINLNGGSATFAWPLKYKGGTFAVVGDITAVHAGAITASGYSLTLSTYTVGGRYTPRLHHSPLQPFGQILVGAGHSSGSLVATQGTTPSAAGGAFAANLGGGLDLRATPRLSIRLIEADYLVTTFNNGVNNHQNNLRISTGVVLRF